MNTTDDPAKYIAGATVGLSGLLGGITYAKGVKKAKNLVKNNPVILAGYKHVALDINHCPPADEFIKNSKKLSLKNAGKVAGIVFAVGGVLSLIAEVIDIRQKLNSHINKAQKIKP